MSILSLRKMLRTVQDTIFKASFYLGRPLVDPTFFDIPPPEDASETTIKASGLFAKLGIKFQQSARKSIQKKIETADYLPNPTSKAATAVLTESASLFVTRVLPYVGRIPSQTILCTAFAGCALFALTDEPTRYMVTDAINQLTSTFQQNNKSNNGTSLSHLPRPINRLY